METKTQLVRLQKLIADIGICSRRRAEVFILAGEVSVNGKLAEIGQKVDPCKDHITMQGKTLKSSSQTTCTLLLNKPKGLVCTNLDPHHGRTVFDLLPPRYCKIRLFCAGRLDKESEGLLILTNDGALAQRLTHPSYRVLKRYRLTLDKPFDRGKIPLLLRGLTVEGELLKVEKVYTAKKGVEKVRRVEVHLQHGRKREIRRLFSALGYNVERLYRFQVGKLVLRGLGSGRCRLLQEKEISLLFSN